jgi:hypothetical protein
VTSVPRPDNHQPGRKPRTLKEKFREAAADPMGEPTILDRMTYHQIADLDAASASQADAGEIEPEI